MKKLMHGMFVYLVIIMLSSTFVIGAVITLDEANTEITDDSKVRSNRAGTNYGNDTWFSMGNTTYLTSSYIRFALPDFGNDVSIRDARIYLTMNGGAAGSENVIGTYHIFGSNWLSSTDGGLLDEDNITYNNQPCGTWWDNSTHCNLTAMDSKDYTFGLGIANFSVTSAVSTQYSLSELYVSLGLTPTSSDASVLFNSKESSTGLPSLVINFTTQKSIIYSVSLNPTTVYANSVLNCSADYLSNISGGGVDFKWYKNEVHQSLYDTTINGVDEGETVYTNVSITEDLVAGDTWTCGARAYNTTTYSDWQNSTKETVLGVLQWHANQTSIITQYTGTSYYNFFNISWNASNGTSVDTVLLQTNISGGVQQYIMSNSYGGQVYNYTFSSTVAAGGYSWVSIANTTQGESSTSDTFTFFVSLNSNECHINITGYDWTSMDSNMSVNSDVSVNTSGYCDGGSANIFYNGPSVGNPHVTTHGVGSHTYVVNSTGDENYSSASITVTLTSVSPPVFSIGGGGGGSTIVEESCGFVLLKPVTGTASNLFCPSNSTSEKFDFALFNTIGENKEFSFYTDHPGCEFSPETAIVEGEGRLDFQMFGCLCPQPGEVNTSFNVQVMSGECSDTIVVTLEENLFGRFLNNPALFILIGLIVVGVVASIIVGGKVLL